MNKLHVIILVALTNMAMLSAAKADRAGGGGSLSTPTPKEIKADISDVLNRGEFFAFQKMQGLTIQDPQLKALFSKMTPDQIQDDIRKSKIDVKDTGPCVDSDGEEREAGVAVNELHSTICYSVSLLSVIPKYDFKRQIIALTAHELAHHFGAKEKLAKKVEGFFAGYVLRSEPLFFAAQINSLMIKEVEYLLRELNQKQVDTSTICVGLGYFSGLTQSYDNHLDMMTDAASEGIINYGISSGAYPHIGSRDLKLLSYCDSFPSMGFDPHPEMKPIAKGDSAALTQALQTELVALQKDKSDLPARASDGGIPSR